MSVYRKILVVFFALFLSSCAATPILTGKGDMSREIKQKAPVVFQIAISPDGRYALSGSLDSFILWDVLQGKKIQTFHHDDWMGQGIAIAFSPDGKYFASGGKGAKLWDLATRREIMTYDDSPALAIAFSPDGKYFLCGGPGPSLFIPKPTLKIFDVATGGEIIDFKIRPSLDYRLQSVAYSPDGKYVLSGSMGGIIDLWDISLGRSIRTTVKVSDGIRAVSFSSDGEYALSGGYDNSVRLWNVKNLTQVKKFVGHTGNGIWSVAFSPDGKYALSAGHDGQVKIWDLASGTDWRSLVGHTGGGYGFGVALVKGLYKGLRGLVDGGLLRIRLGGGLKGGTAGQGTGHGERQNGSGHHVCLHRNDNRLVVRVEWLAIRAIKGGGSNISVWSRVVWLWSRLGVAG